LFAIWKQVLHEYKYWFIQASVTFCQLFVAWQLLSVYQLVCYNFICGIFVYFICNVLTWQNICIES
jgi:hypothetical protein